jgi:hypothetical protein
MTGELKAKCIAVLQEFVADFQRRKSEVDDTCLKHYMDSSRRMAYIDQFPAPPAGGNFAGKKKEKKKEGKKESGEQK